ncbi:MAG: dihydropteroate synthase [Actinomycetota bacterium]|nr:dihydropteroate synthase [Actinomycetota bacterium]
MADASQPAADEADGRARLLTPLLSSAERTTGAVLELSRRRFDFTSRIAVMGIVNRTPDSFYDRGGTFDFDAAYARGHRLIAEGVDIVDVGGVKAGPGPPVSVDDERDRILPIIEALRAESDVVISADTYRPEVAAAALEAGADLVNDVSGGHNGEILDVVAEHEAGYVAVHHGGEPRTRPFRRGYHPDVTTAVVDACAALAERAIERGVARTRILVDPGHDFQKTTYHSLELSRRLPELVALGYPVLVAVSNKDFIGETLAVGLHERVGGSLATAVFCVLRGAHVVRAHESSETLQAVRMTEALLGWHGPAFPVRGLE